MTEENYNQPVLWALKAVVTAKRRASGWSPIGSGVHGARLDRPRCPLGRPSKVTWPGDEGTSLSFYPILQMKNNGWVSVS